MELEILSLFKDALQDINSSAQMQMLVLEALTAMCSALSHHPDHLDKFIDTLFNTGLISDIENLQNHKNNEVYEKAYNLIVTYLQTESYV